MKLVIAENELLCRENLASIDLETIGVELAGIAKYGAEALELSKRIKSDVLISDIEMPKMAGIELVETLSNILPEIKIIILTVYSNFEYIQKSVPLGIFKHIQQRIFKSY